MKEDDAIVKLVLEDKPKTIMICGTTEGMLLGLECPHCGKDLSIFATSKEVSKDRIKK